MLIGVVSMAICYKPIHQLIKLNMADDFEVKKPANNIRVMSWNVEHFDILEHKTHPEVKVKMLDLINKYMPDVACFQEMVGGDEDPSAINYVPTIAAKLGFSQYFYSYNKKDDFDNKHHFGIIIFSRYPIIKTATIENDPFDYNTTFQQIDIVKNTDTIRVLNVHLQSLKFSNTNKQYIENPTLQSENDIEKSKNIISKLKTGFLKRKRQSDYIRAAMDKSPYPLIVCGDFNDVPNSYAYNTIGKNMLNAFVEKGSGIGRTFSAISPTLRIDNIFVSPTFQVQQYIRIPKIMSDHYPIITDIKIERNKGF
ncbi:endonuclease/exonuclease/phosphatase family protein [Ferruginibacter yonginensis]|uniref:Endonuclease/exonuclease/phosphatase family protein n=1 Tax=Ferruginibacter yonginensis TaxID=1310416 RepID=A0ABV8QU07_9BACT